MQRLLYSIPMAFLALHIAVGAPPQSQPDQPPSIVPLPGHMNLLPGRFQITSKTVIARDPANADVARVSGYLAGQLKTSTGMAIRERDIKSGPPTNAITLTLITDASLGDEGYVLNVTTQGATIQAGTPAGLFYGTQTVLQLLPPSVFATRVAHGVTWSIPCVTIQDTPRFGWRGMMLDVSRHFFPKEFVKMFIDYVAMHKMNHFHWHLNDDQGWRIEIKRYPKLTEVSAWRADLEDVHWNARRNQRPGEPATYGGYYTQDEIREIVSYARDRFITVVPEIEMPAHATAVLAAFPQLSCTGGPFTVPPGGIWPIKDIYCAGNDSVYAFLENVIAEVAPLFPGEYLHIGGDEADKTEWRQCPKCQGRIKAEGLKDEAELQSYFVKRMEKVLKIHNKRLIGWDEILEGGLAPEATVMSWRGVNGGIIAAREKHDVVMAPTSNCYFDYYQGDPVLEPIAIGGNIPLQKVYAFEPTVEESLTTEQSRHILGAQANLWTEYIPTPAKAEYMIFPRIAAIAEIGWSPKELRNWDDFAERMGTQFKRYTALGVNYAHSLYSVAMSDSFDTTGRKRIVTLSAQIGSDLIRYTLDGSAPTAQSRSYTDPLVLSRSTRVKAATFKNGKRLGAITSLRFPVATQAGQTVSLVSQFDERFGGRGAVELVDGCLAAPTARDKGWLTLAGRDFEAVVDLGATVPVKRIAASFLHEYTPLIFLPQRVELAVSRDGRQYHTVASLPGKALSKEARPYKHEFFVALKNRTARYIRVTAKNPGPTPEWHRRAGEPTSIAIDEITVE